MATTKPDEDTEELAAVGTDSGHGSSVEAGRSVRKVDGRGLVTGLARYTDDIETAGALEVRVLRSPHAHARMVSVDPTAAEARSEVRAVITHADVPDHRTTRTGFPRPAPIPKDEYVITEKVRYAGEAVAAVAAETAEAAEAAVEEIEVEYDVLEPVIDADEALAEGAPVVHDEPEYVTPIDTAEPSRNVVAEVEHERGDIEAGFGAADLVLEDRYETQVVQHAPMEMNTTIAWIDDRDRLVLRTSTQIPHLCKHIIAEAFDLPLNRVQVIKPRVGGGFGVKQDVPPSQFLAAALALETGEMVRLENSRTEDLHVAQTRHAVKTRVRTGVTASGELLAVELDLVSNSGAYACHGPTTMSSGAHEALSLYAGEGTSLRFRGTSVYTNLPPGGAMRGYGTVQATFALESHMKEVADELDIDPIELRLDNAIDTGDEAFEGERVSTDGPVTSCALRECIERVRDEVGWGEYANEEPGWRRGFGLSLAMHKSGVPRDELAGAELILESDGSFTLMMGVGDAGQGAETTMAQIAASVFGVKTSRVTVRADDTDTTPYDNGAYASSTTYVSGTAAEKAARAASEQVRTVAARLLSGDPAGFEVDDGGVTNQAGKSISLEAVAEEAATGANGPKTQIRGWGEHYTGHSPKPFAAQAAEVRVDETTGEFEVLQLISAADCGFAINPENARGQVIGGAIMGLGQAVSEEIAFDEDGRPTLAGLKDYEVLRSTDLPDRVEGYLVESYEESGPFGAKSVGEVTNIGPPAAVANAVKDAVGVRVPDIPITQEKIADRLAVE